MNKEELLKKLGEVSGELENFLLDSALLTAVQDLRDIQGTLDEIINKVEDEGLESDTDKEENNEKL